jgi:Leucine-rich repeat (LRR) protein
MLTYLDMCGTGPTDEEMAAMRARYPQIKFVWFTTISKWTIRTDIQGFSTGNRYTFPNGAGKYTGDIKEFSYKRIREEDFENLKYCTDIIALDIGHCTRIKHLDFLEYVPQLRYLDIALCDFTDITPIGTLKNLEYLQMMYNIVSDITPLRNCQELRFLNLSDNRVSEIETVLSLQSLNGFQSTQTNSQKHRSKS